MRDRIRRLKQERAKLVADARAILESAPEGGSLDSEQESRYDAMLADVKRLGATIDRLERQLELEETLGEPAADPITADPESRTRPSGVGQTRGGDSVVVPASWRRLAGEDQAEIRFESYRASEAYRTAFRRYLTGSGGRVVDANQLRAPGSPELSGAELRALQADLDTAGGYLTVPEQFVRTLIAAVDDMVFVRSLATVIPVPNATSLGAPSRDADVADADWTAEIQTGSEDSTLAFGKRELNPHPLAKRIKVAEKLLRVAALSPEAIVRERLAYKFSTTQENGFLNGTGSNQPLGVFTASSDGISTSRDVSTGNTTTAITVDGLIEAKYSLKAQYWRNARWAFHRDAVKQIAKARSDSGAGAGTGEYLWHPSVRDGQPDMLLGRPVIMSEFVPNTFTTGLYVGMLADWSHYWIADALSIRIQRLSELYAETNQVGFIARAETDGMPVLEEAFVRVTLA